LLRRTSLHLIHTLEHTSTTGHGGTQGALQRGRNENLKVGGADVSEEAGASRHLLFYLLHGSSEHSTHGSRLAKKWRRAPGYVVPNLTQTNPQIILNSG
jgi:hypothetical protein